MKKLFFLLIVVLTGLFVNGQNTKIEYLNKRGNPVDKSKAAYQKTTTNQDGVVTIRTVDLKRNTEKVEHYKNNVPFGKWQFINQGKIESEVAYEDLVYKTTEELIKELQLKNASTFDTVGFIKPSFPGGDTGRIKFLQQNLVYPQYSRENGEQGVVYITFIVRKDGTIEQPVVSKSRTPNLDFESVRVIKLMPKWNPATINGQPIDVLFTMPVKFTLAS